MHSDIDGWIKRICHKQPETIEGRFTVNTKWTKPHDTAQVLINERREKEDLLVHIEKVRASVSMTFNTVKEKGMRDKNEIQQFTEDLENAKARHPLRK